MEMGGSSSWSLEGFDTQAGRPSTIEFEGRLLGEASSRAPKHAGLVHDEGSFAPPGLRCSACRWFEVRIYTADEMPDDEMSTDAVEAAWIVETVGKSVVPGETDRRQFRRVTEPRQVIGVLVQTKRASRPGEEGDTFIPATSRHALDQAADRDDRLTDVIDQLVVFD